MDTMKDELMESVLSGQQSTLVKHVTVHTHIYITTHMHQNSCIAGNNYIMPQSQSMDLTSMSLLCWQYSKKSTGKLTFPDCLPARKSMLLLLYNTTVI